MSVIADDYLMKKIVICPNKFMMLIMAVSSMEII
jgi:hypothetical protein